MTRLRRWIKRIFPPLPQPPEDATEGLPSIEDDNAALMRIERDLERQAYELALTFNRIKAETMARMPGKQS